MASEELSEELEALTAILDEDTVDIVSDESSRPTEICVKLTPLTASEQEKQYVSLELVVKISESYPSSPPLLGVKNPRGLEDDAVESLLSEMAERCEDYKGCPVMFELIEMGREFLTARNVPVVRCIICLNNIQEEDQFMKTECLHFFHKHCLGRYITNAQESHKEQVAEAQKNNMSIKDFKVLCPVCRECISEQHYNLSDLLNSNPPRAEMSDLPKNSITEDIKMLQKKMQKLFQKQKEKGGIIDLEAEKNKFLVVTNSTDGSENKGDTNFEELSPTDYQLDEAGIPCANVPGSSPKKNQPEPHQPEEVQSYSYKSDAYRGKGRNGKRGFNHRKELSSESPDERERRNAQRKNHFLNKGKSHHQLKKDKKGCSGNAEL